ncbi:hypothetical protein HDU77_006197 [Chytriomyces hyalinus]|nr:hypothetical protein HDU77_006197 [Chytriomyces hyalinus]
MTPSLSTTPGMPLPDTQKQQQQQPANLSITDIRNNSATLSLAATSNLSPLITAGLSQKSAIFPQSSARFDVAQNSKTSPFHKNGSLPASYGASDEPIRSIPTLVLYDDAGLDIYDAITYVEEYYLTNAEMQIFMDLGDEIMDSCVGDGGVLIELGVGSMRKTKYLLDAIVRQGKSVTYYALDLSAQSLSMALSPLASHYPTIQFVGLLGTYDDSLSYIQTNIPRPVNSTRTLLWLGSSIGNYSRAEAAEFLKRVQTIAMDTGDTFLCGIDRRNNAAIVKAAYDDPKGVTRDFILNGLDHVERILDIQDTFKRDLFEYVSIYNDDLGRHEAYYRSLVQQTLVLSATETVVLEKGELINVEYSVKYSAQDVQRLVDGAGFYWPNRWTDASGRYDVHLFQKAPFHLMGISPEDSKKGVPTLMEFEEIFKVWDTISLTMVPEGGHLEKPISLRHPFIFYVGHLPAFMDIQLSRCLAEPFTTPASFTEIFERGIDPDVEDPSKCHKHSKVPDAWPELTQILEYAERCKQRIRSILTAHEKQPQKTGGALARVLWMSYEHYAMHLETFLYMLVQSPNIQPPKGFLIPVHLSQSNKRTAKPEPVPPSHLKAITLPPGTTHISIGHNDSESTDKTLTSVNTHEFGWDNEHPQRQAAIPESILHSKLLFQTRQVTVGEYRAFFIASKENEALRPASWTEDGNFVKTAFGSIEISRCINWPVFVSGTQAAAYSLHASKQDGKHYRVPTEMEITCYRQFLNKDIEGNYAFRSWVPRDVLPETGVIGDGWEWTSTVMQQHAGYEQSKIYPGYSSDFFDGKHCVVLGGSWATAPRLAERLTFRNWYQNVYPFVFAGFRLVCDV